jgi:hypothetical protein
MSPKEITMTDSTELKEFAYWTEKHGEGQIFARNEQEAIDKFYEEHNGNGDYELVIYEVDSIPEPRAVNWYMVLLDTEVSLHSALVFAKDEADARSVFHETYPEVKALNLEVYLATECPKCHYMNYKQSTVRDSWNIDLYSCYVCESCAQQYGGDLDHA